MNLAEEMHNLANTREHEYYTEIISKIRWASGKGMFSVTYAFARFDDVDRAHEIVKRLERQGFNIVFNEAEVSLHISW